jgi:ubiquinone/menaquinone biosynthesis C-methylase UbiE
MGSSPSKPSFLTYLKTRRFRRRPTNPTPDFTSNITIADSTTPLDVQGSSSVLDVFRFIDGRRYHNVESKYSLPNDAPEVQRLLAQHNLFKETWNSNFSSPIENLLLDGGLKVLDIGCGPGSWILDMGASYPKSTFVGVDISPVFAQDNKPPNVGFLQHNLLEGLPFPDDTFDFVWSRMNVASFTEKQWELTLKEMARVTKVGGWVELMEYNIHLHNAGPITKMMIQAARTWFYGRGVIPIISPHLARFMQNTNVLPDVKNEERSYPVGEWGGSLGEQGLEDCLEAKQSFKPLLRPILGIEDQAYDDMSEPYAIELNNNRTYITTYRFYAQKMPNLIDAYNN